MTASRGTDTAGVAVPPPVVGLGSVLLGVGLHRVWPWEVIPSPLVPGLGRGIVVVALLLFGLAVREFLKAGTPLPPHRPTTALVRTGPYRFTRNPIYLSLLLLQIGVAAWLDNAWLFVTVVPAFLVLHFGVILREERYLERRLGEPYVTYRRSVRRWV